MGMISLGGFETVTWIGKYMFRHFQQGKSVWRNVTQNIEGRFDNIATEVLTGENDEGNDIVKYENYHERRYDLFKKIFNLPIYIALFVLTFFGRDIFPFDIFQLDAYYTNKA